MITVMVIYSQTLRITLKLIVERRKRNEKIINLIGLLIIRSGFGLLPLYISRSISPCPKLIGILRIFPVQCVVSFILFSPTNFYFASDPVSQLWIAMRKIADSDQSQPWKIHIAISLTQTLNFQFFFIIIDLFLFVTLPRVSYLIPVIRERFYSVTRYFIPSISRSSNG